MKKPQPAGDGPITKALLDAVTMRREMLDKGHSAAEVDYHVGQGLKALLGNKREQPWRFLCDLCHDTGWVEVPPSTEERARLEALYGSVDQTQPIYNPCGQYCKWNAREREKRRKLRGDDFSGSDDELVMAGQTKKGKGFSKFGR